MTEADLRDLGIHRIPIPVPFVQAGGSVNVYLVEEAGGGILMVDSGLCTPEARTALAQGFERAGRRFDEVTRIVVSHGHVDHYGGARAVMERAGRDVHVLGHRDDLSKIAESGLRWRDRMPLYVAHLERLGVPHPLAAAIGADVGRGFGMARRVPAVTALEPADTLRTMHAALEVHHMPGHTPGLLCLYDARHRLFFSGDHLLEKVSPNPIIELGPNGEEGVFRPLVAYLESIGRLQAMDVDLVLPGHGAPFGGHRRVIDGLLHFHRKRQARTREVLSNGPLTCYQVTQALFPSARGANLFLAVSETVANLEVLEVRGDVIRELAGGVYRFRLA